MLTVNKSHIQTDPIMYWGEQLFNNIYLCSVKQKDLLTDEEIRVVGVFSTGDAEWDDGWQNTWTQAYITINDMVEFFKKGINFKICNISDTKYIFTSVNNFLIAWADQLKYGLNNKDAPIDDLMAMVNFSAAVNQWASGVDAGNLIQEFGGIGRMFEFTRDSLTKQNSLHVFDTTKEEKRKSTLQSTFIDALRNLSV